MASQQDLQAYQATDIKLLEGLEPVRKRPGMYIGSTDSKGLHHLVKEILDNAVDEAIGGFGKKIEIFRSPLTEDEEGLAKSNDLGNQSITVVDSGRGIPIEVHEKAGVSALEVVMTKLHAGGKFEETVYQASGGLHGIGSSAVNALSGLMQVISKRNGKYFYQSYSKGDPHRPVAEISKKEVVKLFPDQTKTYLKNNSGTLVHFIPDKTIFSTTNFSHQKIVQILKDRAYLMAGIYFTLTDRVANVSKHFYYENGIKSLVEHLNMGKDVINNVFYTNDTWEDKESGKKMGVEIALQYNDSYREIIDSFVNVINTPDGGTHVNGFTSALSRVLREYSEKHELLHKGESFVSNDIKEGLTAVVFIKMSSNDLQFESQTKTRLNNSEAQSAVYRVFKESFETYLEENPKQARAIVEKILLSARARRAARAAKDAVTRKGVLEGTSLPGKLADCQSRKPEECEIYIVEGDSAGGCFSGDTKIALVDGRKLNFKQIIAEQKQNKKHYCYTIRKNGKIGIEQIINPRKTKSNAQVIKIIIDNGEQIICTPDHKFMLRSGKYKKADQLTTQDSLMPLYKKYFGEDQHLALEVIANYNHKIISVEKLNKKIDVYDIEVPHTHNFALASGVFVHNSAKQGRDRKFQAIFPLRGKILNTERARLDRMLKTEEIKNLIIALGAGIGETYNSDNLRYHRIILMNDADVDGEHITTLGLTLFYRHLPKIVEEGHLYVALPPLYKLSYGKKEKYVYSEEEMGQEVEKIKKKNPEAKISMQRYKGLGEMNPDQLWETTMSPETRILKKITIDDAKKADLTFEVLMGDKVPPRKKFIQTHAHMAELDI